MSDPEWAIFWVNYKLLKKKIKGIVESSKGIKNQTSSSRQTGCSSNPADISKNVAEVEFFRVVRAELKKTRYVVVIPLSNSLAFPTWIAIRLCYLRCSSHHPTESCLFFVPNADKESLIALPSHHSFTITFFIFFSSFPVIFFLPMKRSFKYGINGFSMAL